MPGLPPSPLAFSRRPWGAPPVFPTILRHVVLNLSLWVRAAPGVLLQATARALEGCSTYPARGQEVMAVFYALTPSTPASAHSPFLTI